MGRLEDIMVGGWVGWVGWVGQVRWSGMDWFGLEGSRSNAINILVSIIS